MQIDNSILNRYLYSNSTKLNINWAVQKFYNYFCWHFTLYRSDVLNCFSYRMKSLCWFIIVTYVQRPKSDSKPVSIGHNEGSYFKCRHTRLWTKNLDSLCFPPQNTTFSNHTVECVSQCDTTVCVALNVSCLQKYFHNHCIFTNSGNKMMIQQQARQNLQDKVQKWDPGHRDVQVRLEEI